MDGLFWRQSKMSDTRINRLTILFLVSTCSDHSEILRPNNTADLKLRKYRNYLFILSTFASSVPLMASMTPGANLNLTPGSKLSVRSLAIMAVCMTSHTASLMCSVLSMYPPRDNTSHWLLIPDGKLAKSAVKNTITIRHWQSIVCHGCIQLVCNGTVCIHIHSVIQTLICWLESYRIIETLATFSQINDINVQLTWKPTKC